MSLAKPVPGVVKRYDWYEQPAVSVAMLDLALERTFTCHANPTYSFHVKYLGGGKLRVYHSPDMLHYQTRVDDDWEVCVGAPQLAVECLTGDYLRPVEGMAEYERHYTYTMLTALQRFEADGISRCRHANIEFAHMEITLENAQVVEDLGEFAWDL